MEKPKFLSFRRPNGHNEFEEFMESLPIKDFQKLHAVITSIEEFGILTAIQQEWVKSLIQKSMRYVQKYLQIFRESFISTKVIICILLLTALRKNTKDANKRNKSCYNN